MENKNTSIDPHAETPIKSQILTGNSNGVYEYNSEKSQFDCVSPPVPSQSIGGRVQGDIPLSKESQEAFDKMFNMFTQEELIQARNVFAMVNEMQYYVEGVDPVRMLNKIQSLIQPEPLPPVEGSVYELEGLVGYCLESLLTEAHFVFDKENTKGCDFVVFKMDWHKLVLLKPVK